MTETDFLGSFADKGGALALFAFLLFAIIKNGKTIMTVLEMFKERPDYTEHLNAIEQKFKQREIDILELKQAVSGLEAMIKSLDTKLCQAFDNDIKHKID